MSVSVSVSVGEREREREREEKDEMNLSRMINAGGEDHLVLRERRKKESEIVAVELNH